MFFMTMLMADSDSMEAQTSAEAEIPICKLPIITMALYIATSVS